MITRFWLGRRREGLSRAAFSDHWYDVHAPLGLAIPGLRAYVQNHLVADPAPNPRPPFDGCSELDFDDVDAMRHAFASPDIAAADRDELAFADTGRFGVVVAQRHVVLGATVPDTSARMLGFLRVNPRRTRAELAQQVDRLLTDAAAETGAVRAELLIALDDAPEAQACDVVVSLWFPDEDRMRTAVPEWDGRVSDALAGYAFGRETALARPRRLR